MSDFTSQNSLLNLAPKVEIKGASSNSSKPDFYTDDEAAPSFLASLIQALDESNELLPEYLQMNEKEIMQEFILKQNNLFGGLNEEQKTSIFDSLSFMQVLGVLEDLQIQSSEVKLSTLSTQTQQFLQTQSNLDALKGAKNLDELLQIAKNLNLEVSDIKIDRIFELKTTFPNLNKANFFSTSEESIFKEFLNTKIAHIVKENESKFSTTPSKHKTQNTTSLLSKALQSLAKDDDNDLFLKNEVKNAVQKSFESMSNNDELNVKNQKLTPQTSKEPEKQILASEKADKIQSNLTAKQEISTIQPQIRVAPKEKSIQVQENQKEPIPKEANKDLKPSNEILKNEIEIKSAPTKTPFTLSNEPVSIQNKVASNVAASKIVSDTIKDKTPAKEPKKDEKEYKTNKDMPKELKNVVSEKITTDKKPLIQNEKSVDDKSLPKQDESKIELAPKNEPKNTSKTKDFYLNTESKNAPSQGVSKELKVEFAKENMNLPNAENKVNTHFENVMNKTQSKLNDVNLSVSTSQNFSENKEYAAGSQNDEMTSNFVANDDNNELSSIIKNLSQVSRSELKSELNVKETFTRFVQDFKEQMHNYKSPITRFNITLHPSSLGEVEVTLIQRGNNLHINFNSSTNTMNLFIQHQAEFKNSLVNMGFTGLEMNFSDQNKKDKQQQGKNRSGYGFKDEFTSNENNSPLEIILAKYF